MKNTPLALYRELRGNRAMFNGALFSGFSFFSKGVNFLLLLVLANYIAPLEYGYLSLFTSVVMVVGYFIAFSTEGYFTIAYFKDGEEARKRVFTCILVTSLIVLGVLLCVLTIWDRPLAESMTLPGSSLYLAVIIVFFNVFFHTILEYYRIKEDVKTYGILSCSNVLLNFVLSILFVKTFQFGWEGRLYSMIACSAIYGLFALIFFIKERFITRIDKHYWKLMLVWGVPLIPHLATNFIKQGCDRFIINNFHTTVDVGIFSFAMNLATIITMIGFGFNQSNSVDIFKICGDKDMSNKDKGDYLLKQRKRFFFFFLACSIGVVICCMVAVPFLLPKYTESLIYLPILGVYGLLVCYYLVYTNYLFFFNKTKELMFVTFGTAIFHLLLSLWLTRYSLYYTCGIYCVSQILIVLLIRRIALKTMTTNFSE